MGIFFALIFLLALFIFVWIIRLLWTARRTTGTRVFLWLAGFAGLLCVAGLLNLTGLLPVLPLPGLQQVDGPSLVIVLFVLLSGGLLVNELPALKKITEAESLPGSQPLPQPGAGEETGEEQRKRVRREALMQMTLEATMHGVMVTDSAGRVVMRNTMLLQLLNLPDNALQETDAGWKETIARRVKEPQRLLSFFDQILNHPIGETLDIIERSDGRLLECRTRYQYIKALGSGFRIWAFLDCTEQQRRERELAHMGMHDTLTGIYNRAFFEMKLRQLRMVNLYPVCMFMIDVDGLKNVNDRHGHPAGDQLLRQAAIILRQACRAEDIVARLGGDEFGLLLIHADREVADQVADRINGLLNIHNIRHADTSITLSLGYAVAKDAREMETLFSRADETMYEARRIRRSGQVTNSG